LNFPAVTLETDAAQALLAHAWPGHVRELENVVHGAMLLCEDGVIRAQDLRLPFSATSKRESDMGSAHEHESLLDELESLLARLCLAPPEGLFSQVERSLVRVAFAHCGRNQIRAAQLLGLSRNVLRGRLIEHGEINALK
jgi:DNA-binding NtrC family response regulator